MPTSFDDIFYYMDPANPPRVNARLRGPILAPGGRRRVEPPVPCNLAITKDHGNRPLGRVDHRKVDGPGNHARLRDTAGRGMTRSNG